MKKQATWFNCCGIILRFVCISYNLAFLHLGICPGETCTCESGDMYKNVYCIFKIAMSWK